MNIMNSACRVNFNLHMGKILLNTSFFRNWDRLLLIGQDQDGRDGEADGRAEVPGGGAT